MNAFTFDETKTEGSAVRVIQPPPVVAPWFAYLVGSLLAVASAAVIYEVVRVEIALGKVDKVFKSQP